MAAVILPLALLALSACGGGGAERLADANQNASAGRYSDKCGRRYGDRNSGLRRHRGGACHGDAHRHPHSDRHTHRYRHAGDHGHASAANRDASATHRNVSAGSRPAHGHPTSTGAAHQHPGAGSCGPLCQHPRRRLQIQAPRWPAFAANGGGELKLQVHFIHSGVDGGQPQGDYRVWLEKDGQKLPGFDDTTSIALQDQPGTLGKYNYEHKAGLDSLPGNTVAGNYVIWVLDGNRVRDSQNYSFTVPDGQGEVWIEFDQG